MNNRENLFRKKRDDGFSLRFNHFLLSVCIPCIRGKKLLFFSVLSVVILGLSSCAEMAKDMGLDEEPDIQQRAGLTGTMANPAVLDPFKKYNLVMAANECRYFTMKVPEHWYWKIYLTVANRKVGQSGHLEAEIAQTNPPWGALPATSFKKTIELEQGGVQAVLGVGNEQATRPALLKLCQDGVPLKIAIESQVSSTTGLIGPHGEGKDSKAE